MKNKPAVSNGRGGKREGAGRKRGIPNKFTADLKGMILGALDDAGGRDYLTKQASANPGAFLTLVGKVLPKDVNIEANSTVTITDERVKEANRLLAEAVDKLAEEPAQSSAVVH